MVDGDASPIAASPGDETSTPMRWNGWGDPAKAKELPLAVRALLPVKLGRVPKPDAAVALDEVELAPSALDAADRTALAAIVGGDHVASDDDARIRHSGGRSTPDLPFGVNVDPVTSGAAATDGIDERREARRRSREDHALVSGSDIEQAARALPLLEVARAWVLLPDEQAPRTGTVTLVAMRARLSEEEAGSTPETPRWLEAIRRRLAAKMPLATRLAVVGPRYAEFSIRAKIEVAPERNPADIKAVIERDLRSRLALIGTAARRPGVPVTARDLVAWIRVAEGVRRVVALRLVLGSGKESDEIKVPRNGLPRVDLAGSQFEMTRAGAGGVP